MFYLALALTFCSAFLVFAGAWILGCGERLAARARLCRLAGRGVPRYLHEELEKPLRERLLSPLWRKLAERLSRRMAAEKRLLFQRRLQAAGGLWGMGAGEFRLLQLVCGIGLAALLALLGGLGGAPPARLVLVVLLGLGAGFFLPEAYLNYRAKRRREEFGRALPEVLDLLTVSVEAGLGFDLALVKVTERFRGKVVGAEFGKVLHEIKMGRPRREALREMADRLGLEDLSSFVGALLQADQLGVSIGRTLRLQAEKIRRKRRQQAEERALKAPVKMLFPLVFFIFPALFVVLLGPAFIQILRNFQYVR